MKPPLVLALIGLVFGGCSKPPQTGGGFFLPPGDAKRGEAAFVQLKCNTCHTVAGAAVPSPEAPAAHLVRLGGEVTRVRSYGNLVTSIIYPSHSVSDVLTAPRAEAGKSVTMPEVTRDMTVAQLVDIVTFLQPHYKRVVPTSYGYGSTYPVVP